MKMSNDITTALDNIFKKNEPSTIYGKITERISKKKYKIETDSGTEITVQADQQWGLGTYVRVENGFIKGTGKRAGSFKVYRV
jgi:hypothetical protein